MRGGLRPMRVIAGEKCSSASIDIRPVKCRRSWRVIKKRPLCALIFSRHITKIVSLASCHCRNNNVHLVGTVRHYIKHWPKLFAYAILYSAKLFISAWHSKSGRHYAEDFKPKTRPIMANLPLAYDTFTFKDEMRSRRPEIISIASKTDFHVWRRMFYYDCLHQMARSKAAPLIIDAYLALQMQRAI